MFIRLIRSAMQSRDGTSRLHTFVQELKRREVFQTAGLYAVGAFLLTEIALAFIDRSPFSASTKALASCVLVSLFIGGFPIVLWLAWLFDLTRHGIVREENLVRGRDLTAATAISAVVFVTGLALWSFNPCGFGRVLGVAVLPCSYHGTTEQEFRARGVSAELNYRLSHLPQLHVPANVSVSHFSDRVTGASELSHALGTDRLVACTFRQNDSRITFNLRLYRPGDDKDLWTGEFGGQSVDEVFLVADAFGDLVGIDAINVAALAGARIDGVNSMPTVSHDAWSLFQHARHKELVGDLEPALEFYSQAAIIDPAFIRAHTSAARLMWVTSEELPTLDAARAHIRRALQDSPPLAETRFVQRLLFDTGEDPDSLHAEIISHRPSYAEEYLFWGAWLARNDRLDEAESALAKAQSLDPSGLLEKQGEYSKQR